MRRTRTYGITVACLVAALVGLAVLLRGGAIDGGAATAVDDVGELLAATFAAAACWSRARRAPRERRAWSLLAASAAAWAAGQAYWTWAEVTGTGPVPSPSWADAGYVAALPLAAIGLSVLRREAGGMRAWLRAALDGVLVSTALACLSWVTVLGPFFATDPGAAVTEALSVLYWTADVAIVTIAIVVMSRESDRRRRTRVALLAVGYAAIGFADAAFAWMSSNGDAGGGHLANLGWAVGFAVIGMAALLPGRSAPPVDADVGPPRVALVVSYVPVVLWLVTVVSVQLLGDGIDGFVFWCSVIVVVTLMLRQGLALSENAALTQHLEARVEERTAEIEARDARFAALVRHATDVIAVVPGPQLRTTYVSPSAEHVLGWSTTGGVDVLDHVHPDDLPRWDLALVKLGADDSATTAFECRVRDDGGQVWRDVEVTLTDLRDDPHVAGMVINLRDITVRRALEVELREQGLRDPLTNLANRVLLRDRMLHALARHGSEHVGVIAVDVDDFARINDEIGEEGGDRVIAEVGRRLREASPSSDTVARHAGDRFIVLVDGDIGGGRLERLAAELRERCHQPIDVLGATIVLTTSVGIAPGRAGTSADGLLAEATTALAVAKRDGKDQARTFTPEMRRVDDDRQSLEGELQRALERDELIVHYQPLFATGTRTIVGAEALVRWNHPERGMVPPGAFIPLAEQCGLIVPIGTWVLDRACRDAASWPTPVGVSVNLSSRQLERDDLVPIVRDALARHELDPSRLTLEVTESLVLADIERTVAALEELRALGAHVAIDDFGTGFSSLSYLERLPADSLKIDRSFVVGLGAGTDRGVVSTIIDLAAKLGMHTVAEGVEEEEQFQILRFLGADVIQGFLFARPMANDDLVALLAAPAAEDLLDLT